MTTEVDSFAEKISKITGIPPSDVRQTWERVKQNRIALDSCDRHDFCIDMTIERPVGKRWKCINCGGEVSSENKYWYELGTIHIRDGSQNNN